MTEPPLAIGTLQARNLELIAPAAGVAPRNPIRPEEMWMDMSLIPTDPPPLLADLATLGVVTLRLRLPIAAVPGQSNLYTAPGIVAVIPATTGTPGNLQPTLLTPPQPAIGYGPVLEDSLGRRLSYHVKDWIIDGVNSLIELRSTAAISLTPPLTVSFFQYNGAVAGVATPTAWVNNGVTVSINPAHPAYTGNEVFVMGAGAQLYITDSIAGWANFPSVLGLDSGSAGRNPFGIANFSYAESDGTSTEMLGLYNTYGVYTEVAEAPNVYVAYFDDLYGTGPIGEYACVNIAGASTGGRATGTEYALLQSNSAGLVRYQGWVFKDQAISAYVGYGPITVGPLAAPIVHNPPAVSFVDPSGFFNHDALSGNIELSAGTPLASWYKIEWGVSATVVAAGGGQLVLEIQLDTGSGFATVPGASVEATMGIVAETRPLSVGCISSLSPNNLVRLLVTSSNPITVLNFVRGQASIFQL